MGIPSLNSDNQHHSPISSSGGEISAVEILYFFKHFYKVIFGFALLGLCFSVIYLYIAQKQYEAVAFIRMGQVGFYSNFSDNKIKGAEGNSIASIGINIENPSQLIARLALTSGFPPDVLSACNLRETVESSRVSSKFFKLLQPKGMTNEVELKAFGSSPGAAKHCASAIFDFIKATQNQIAAPYVEEIKARLADDEVRLRKARQLLAAANKSTQSIDVVYLSTRDEIRYLVENIGALKAVIDGYQGRAAQLINPIYADEVPISPIKKVVLGVGLFGGLFFGLLLAIVLQLWIKFGYIFQEAHS